MKIMKKVVMVFALFVCMSTVQAFYEISYACEYGLCLEHQPIYFNVTIYNLGGQDIIYTEVEIVSASDGSIIGDFDPEFRPLSSDRGDIIKIDGGRSYTFNFSGILPRVTRTDDLIFYPCFSTAVPGSDWVHRTEDIYELRSCYFNETMKVYDCIDDQHCKSNEFCEHNRCVPFECGACQYIANNSCFDYECCSPGMCAADETCTNNECVLLDCSVDEFIVDHSCTALDCPDKEAAVNHSCVALDCAFEEHAFNHSCQPLDCRKDEFIWNHSCQKLNCGYMQATINHTCVSLNCSYDEKIKGTACAKLDCSFYQRIEQHSCVVERDAVYSFSGEILALLAIVFFVILDVHKAGMKKRGRFIIKKKQGMKK